MQLHLRGLSALSFFIAAAAYSAPAQTLLKLPEASQRASISQRIGLTDITVVYHRPVVNGRKVWGGLVPYNQVWRAGANENTTIAFNTPVSVEGKPLAAGTYGLHMLPGTDEWTVIFSKNHSSWGSFTYKQDEDALRVTVKPQPAEIQEALAYSFEDVKPDSAAVTMRWERLAVPFHVSANEKEITMSSLRDQLRGGLQYTWEGWAEAANYSLANKVDLDQGLLWADEAIKQEERYDTVMLKARILDAQGKGVDAVTFKSRALAMANPIQFYMYGRQMQLNHQNPEEVMSIFRQTAQKYPDNWIGHLAAARVSSAAGDYRKAAAELTAATAGAPDIQKPGLANYLKKVQAGQDMNQ